MKEIFSSQMHLLMKAVPAMMAPNLFICRCILFLYWGVEQG